MPKRLGLRKELRPGCPRFRPARRGLQLLSISEPLRQETWISFESDLAGSGFVQQWNANAVRKQAPGSFIEHSPDGRVGICLERAVRSCPKVGTTVLVFWCLRRHEGAHPRLNRARELSSQLPPRHRLKPPARRAVVFACARACAGFPRRFLTARGGRRG